MNTTSKQELFSTAFSKIYNVYVSLSHAHQDVDGNWIFTCSSNYSDDESKRFTNVLHKEQELSNFVL